ncbi:MAG: hypothetical protein V1697_02500 [Candidatus Levyibacteriota bacterium]
MVGKFFWPIFIVAFFFELVLTTMPLVLIVFLNLFVFSKKEWVFILAFISGIILDILSFRPLGYTSIFFVSSLFFISLYERKFEISTVYFIFIMSIILSAIYLVIFNKFSLIESIFSGLVGAVIFLIFNFLEHKKIDASTSKRYDTKEYFKKT